MRTPKEFILSLLSREVRVAYRTRDDALELRDQARDKSASTSRILDRAFKETKSSRKLPNTGARKQTQSSSFSPISSAR